MMRRTKILAIVGGPRKQGNSDTLVNHLLEAAWGCGAETRKEYVVDWDIHPLCDPTACQEEGAPCSAPDEANRRMDLMLHFEVIVFAAPLYWWGPPAQLKAFVDRWFCRWRELRKGLRGHTAFLVHTRADDEDPGAAGPFVDMMRRSTAFLGMKWAGDLGGVAGKKGDILHNHGALEAAREWGRRLAGEGGRSERHRNGGGG